MRPLPNTDTVTHHSSSIHNIGGKVHFAKPNRLVMSALNGGIITFERSTGVRNALEIAMIMQSGATITKSTHVSAKVPLTKAGVGKTHMSLCHKQDHQQSIAKFRRSHRWLASSFQQLGSLRWPLSDAQAVDLCWAAWC